MDATENEGLAVSRLSGYRTKRPNKRPRKTFGHGVKIKWRDRLKKKKEPIFTRPVAVPKPNVPDFLTRMLAARPEARRIMSAAQYEAIKNKSPK